MKYFNNWHEKRREWIVDRPLTLKGDKEKSQKFEILQTIITYFTKNKNEFITN